MSTQKEIKEQLNQLLMEEREIKNQRNTAPSAGDAAIIDLLLEGFHSDFGSLEGIYPRKQKLLAQLKRLEMQDQPKPSNWITQTDIDLARTVPIGEFVDDKLRGRPREKIRCIFHDDKSPSCIYYTDQNTFHCYVCNFGGGVLDWTMRKYNYKFIEAVRFLIKK